MTIIAWILKHEALALWGAILAAALGAVLLIRHDGKVIAAQKVEIQGAAATAAVQNKVQGAADAAANRADIYLHQAQGATDAIHNAAGASDPLPDAVVLQWASGIDGLRHDTGPSGRQSPPKP